MDISPELQVLLEKAHITLRSHPETDLPLGYRQAIQCALGPYYDVQQNRLQSAAAVGYKRRGVLAILTARYVLPIWQLVIPSGSATQKEVEAAAPIHSLLKAQRILTGQIPIPVEPNEWHALNQFYSYIWQNLLLIMETEDVDQTWPTFAGWAALMAFGEMKQDLQVHPPEIDLMQTDEEFTMDERDYACYAAAAYADGTPDWPSADQARRRQFWNWWLTEAVPMAWHAVKADGSFQNTAWQLPVQSDTDGQDSFLHEQATGHQQTNSRTLMELTVTASSDFPSVNWVGLLKDEIAGTEHESA